MRYVTSLVLLVVFTATTVHAQDCAKINLLPAHLSTFMSQAEQPAIMGNRVATLSKSGLSDEQHVTCITGDDFAPIAHINADGPISSADEELWLGNAWQPNTRVEYEYDENDRRTNELFLRWNANEETYVEETARLYFYDGNTNTAENISQTWNGSEFVNQYRNLFERDSFDNMVRIERFDWENGDWKTRFLSNSVVENGLVTETTIQTIYELGILTNAQLLTFEYDGEGRRIRETQDQWNSTSQSWRPDYRYLTSYSESNTVTLMQRYEAGNWVDLMQETIVYNDQGLEVEWSLTFVTEGVRGTRHFFTYDNGNLTEILSQEQDEMGNWIDHFRQSTTLDPDGDPLTLLIQMYNRDAMAWDNINRVSFNYQQNEKTTSVEEEMLLGLASFDIYPYPAQDRVNVELQLTQASDVQIEIFDVLGRRIANLKEGMVSAGIQQLSWLPQSEPAGLYFVRLTIDGAVDTRPLVLVR